MKILFVNLKKIAESNNIVHPTHILAPLDIGYSASVLERSGHKTDFIDLNVDMNVDLKNAIKKRDYDVLILKPYTSSDILDYARYSKKPTFLIGPFATTHYKKFLFDNSPISGCILKEPEYALDNIIKNIAESKSYKGVPGLAYHSKNIKIVPPVQVKDLDDLPFPKHSFFIGRGYYIYYPVNINSRQNVGFVLSSRGCPYDCLFCTHIERDSYDKNYRFRSEDSIVDEMQYLKNKGVNVIYFIDDLFTLKKDRVVRLCQKILSRNLKIRWIVQSRIDTIDYETAKIMKRAGCSTICFGVESLNQKILNVLNKKISPEMIIKTISMTRKIGLLNVGYFIIGTPGENINDLKYLPKKIKNMPLDLLQLHYFTPISGSRFDMDQELFKFDLDYNMSNIPDKELKKIFAEIYRSFYFRPRYILNFIRKNFLSILLNFRIYNLLIKKVFYVTKI